MAEKERIDGLLLCDDLIFASRITGTARDLGFAMRQARSPAELEPLLAQVQPACVIVDLANPGLYIVDLAGKLSSQCATRPFLVGYGSHVDTATLRRAREAGCDLVLPRSKFVEVLPDDLPSWFKAGTARS